MESHPGARKDGASTEHCGNSSEHQVGMMLWLTTLKCGYDIFIVLPYWLKELMTQHQP